MGGRKARLTEESETGPGGGAGLIPAEIRIQRIADSALRRRTRTVHGHWQRGLSWMEG